MTEKEFKKGVAFAEFVPLSEDAREVLEKIALRYRQMILNRAAEFAKKRGKPNQIIAQDILNAIKSL